MTRICKVCGWATEGGERDCLECGAPLPELEEQQENREILPENVEIPPETVKPAKKRRWVWLAVLGLILALAAGLFWAAKGRDKGDNRAVAVVYRGENAQEYVALMTHEGVYRIPTSQANWLNCDKNGELWIFRGSSWAEDNSARWLGNSWFYNNGELQTVSWGPVSMSWDGLAVYYVNLDGTEQVLYRMEVKSGKSAEITRADSISNLVSSRNGKAVCFQADGKTYHWMEPYGVEELGEWTYANPGGTAAGAIYVASNIEGEGAGEYLIWRDETGKLGEPEPVSGAQYPATDFSQVICLAKGKGYTLKTQAGEELIFPGTGDYSQDFGEMLVMLNWAGEQTTLTDWFYRYQGKLFYLDPQGKPEEIAQLAAEDWVDMWITENHDKLYYLDGGELYVVENPKESRRVVKRLATAGAVSVWFSPNMKEIYLGTEDGALHYLPQEGEPVKVGENCQWAAPQDDGSCYFITWEKTVCFTSRGEPAEELDIQGEGTLYQWRDGALCCTREGQSLQAWKLEKGGVATKLEDLELPKEEEKPAPLNPFGGLFAKEERRFPQPAEGWLHYNYFDQWVASEQGIYPLEGWGSMVSASEDFSAMVVTNGGKLYLLTGESVTPLEGELGWLSGDGRVLFQLEEGEGEQTLSRMEIGKDGKTQLDTGELALDMDHPPVIAYDGSAVAYPKEVNGRRQTWQWTIRHAAQDTGLGQLQELVSLGREGLTRTIYGGSLAHAYSSTVQYDYQLQFTESGVNLDLGDAGYKVIQNRDENQVIYHTEEGWFYADEGQEPFNLGISGENLYPVGGEISPLLSTGTAVMNGSRGRLDRLTNWVYRSDNTLYYLSDALEVKELATGVTWAEIDDFGKKLVYWNQGENTVYVMENPLRDSRRLSKLDIAAEITAVAVSKDLEYLYYADPQGDWFRDVADNGEDQLVVDLEEGNMVLIFPLCGGGVWYMDGWDRGEKNRLFFEKPGDLAEQKLEIPQGTLADIDVLPRGDKAVLTVHGNGDGDKGKCYVLDENGEISEKIALKWEGTTWTITWSSKN